MTGTSGADVLERVKEVRKAAEDRIEALDEEIKDRETERATLRNFLLAASGGNTRRPRSTSGGNSGNGRRGREPKRAAEFIRVVKERPGLTVHDISEQMGIKPNYLYRVSSRLVEDGIVRKEGQGYYLIEQQEEPSTA